MAALENLNTNIAALSTAVDNLAPATGGATETQVQTAADAVAAQTARIVAFETPAAPATPPTTPAA